MGKRPRDSAAPLPLGDDETAPVEHPGANWPPRYREVGPVAFGGSGQVVECVDSVLGRRVAIKSARRDAGLDSEVESMLYREARITGSLEHPSIIPVYDAGEDLGGARFFAMRLFAQPSLAVVLGRMADGNLAALAEYRLGRRLRDFVQICRAVDYAHSRGIVHCDLKPANVLLGSFGEVIVVDWGFAYDRNALDGFRGGTPGYMAPEQLDPRCESFDERTDVFGLGALLYELMSLRPVFGGDEDEILSAVHRFVAGDLVLEPPSRVAAEGTVPVSIAGELDAICLRALERDRERRQRSVRDLIRAIEDLLDRNL